MFFLFPRSKDTKAIESVSKEGAQLLNDTNENLGGSKECVNRPFETAVQYAQ